MPYTAAGDRYQHMRYRRSGRSGLQLPAITLGLWHNFGGDQPYETSRAIARRAFDAGITHFDVARLYGSGQAEGILGEFLQFLKQEKKYWLAPIVVVLVLFGLLLVFAQSSAVAPFIYSLF